LHLGVGFGKIPALLSRSQKEQVSPWVCILLSFVTLAAFWPVFKADLLAFDDPIYVNAHVLQGLSWKNVVWAFSNLDAGFWHPLTWLSLMLDAELSGTSAGGYHATSLFLHIANSVLVFLVFQRLTGWLWRSAWVAALFALHPLHVETVAWVADRKDLLGTLFFLLTLLAYARYVELREHAGPPLEQDATQQRGFAVAWKRKPTLWYLLALFLFVLGIMSKTLVVTVPGVLLLLDWWPLDRLHLAAPSSQFSWPELWQKGWRLLLEKLPFIALAFAASALSLFAEKKAGAVTAATARTIPLRIENGILAYASYLRKMVWPADLAPYYPYPTAFPIWKVLLAAALLAGITILVLRQIRRPYLAMGWLWYLGTLVPMIGVIQVGDHSMADRYTYVPLLGIFVAIVWWVAEMSAGRPGLRRLATVGGAACLVGCALLTWNQAGYWRHTRTLFEHVVAVTQENAVAQNDLGVCLLEAGELVPAEQHLREAVRILPGYGSALVNLGNCLGQQDRLDEAIEMLKRAIKTRPDPQSHYNLGYWLIRAGNKAEAEVQFREAVRLSPAYLNAWFNLGLVSLELHKTQQAEEAFRAAVNLQPGFAPAQLKLGAVLVERQKWDEALAHLQAGLQVIPGDIQALKDLGVTLFSLGRVAEAVVPLERGLQAGPDARAHYYLGLALHSQGQFTEALAHYREAVRLEPKTPDYANDLAWLLATCPAAEVRDGKEAVRLAEQLCQENGNEARFWGTLAAAYAEAGRFDEASKMAEKARDMAQRQNRDDVAKMNAQFLELFRQGKPYHTPEAR
jgi:tetratricopeptide (TPR) repeat protein